MRSVVWRFFFINQLFLIWERGATFLQSRALVGSQENSRASPYRYSHIRRISTVSYVLKKHCKLSEKPDTHRFPAHAPDLPPSPNYQVQFQAVKLKTLLERFASAKWSGECAPDKLEMKIKSQLLVYSMLTVIIDQHICK